MGGSEKIPEIVEELHGIIFKDPSTGPFDLEEGGSHWDKGWQTADDSSYYLLCSLEVLDEEKNLERKADMFTKRTIKQDRSVSHVDTAVEALTVSIGEKACVDLSFMASSWAVRRRSRRLWRSYTASSSKTRLPVPLTWRKAGAIGTRAGRLPTTLPIICFVLWKFSTKRRIWSARQICLPSARSNRIAASHM